MAFANSPFPSLSKANRRELFIFWKLVFDFANKESVLEIDSSILTAPMFDAMCKYTLSNSGVDFCATRLELPNSRIRTQRMINRLNKGMEIMRKMMIFIVL